MEPQHKCPYCFIDHIKAKHVDTDHLKMTLDLTDIPLPIIQELKAFFVKRQDFERAGKMRLFEKLAIKQQELMKTDTPPKTEEKPK